MSAIITPIKTAEDIFAYPAFGRICTVVELFKQHFAGAVSNLPLLRDQRVDATDFTFESPFSCEEIAQAKVQTEDCVQLTKNKVCFPHGRGITFHAFDPLAITNALLKSSSTKFDEDNAADWVYERTGTEKSLETTFYRFSGLGMRRAHRHVDGIIIRPSINTLPVNVKNHIITETDERYPLMRLIHDLLLLIPNYREIIHPESVMQCLGDFFQYIPLNNAPTVPSSSCIVDFAPFPMPHREEKLVSSMFVPHTLEDWVPEAVADFKQKANSRSWTVYPHEKNPLCWWYSESAYFNVPTELVTDEMIKRAYEYEEERRTNLGNDYNEERGINMIEKHHTLFYYDQFFELPISYLLDTIHNIILHALRFSEIFEIAFNEDFVDLSKAARLLTFKTKEFELINAEYQRAVPLYHEQYAERLKAGLTVDQDDFLKEIGYLEAKRKERLAAQQPDKPHIHPRSRSRLIAEGKLAANGDDDEEDENEKEDKRQKQFDNLPLTAEEEAMRDSYDFCLLTMRIKAMEDYLGEIKSSIEQISLRITNTPATGSEHFKFLDLLYTRAQNVYIDQVNMKKYTLYTNTSPTYIHLYEEPLLSSDVLPPPPAHSQKLYQKLSDKRQETKKKEEALHLANLEADKLKAERAQAKLAAGEVGVEETAVSTQAALELKKKKKRRAASVGYRRKKRPVRKAKPLTDEEPAIQEKKVLDPWLNPLAEGHEGEWLPQIVNFATVLPSALKQEEIDMLLNPERENSSPFDVVHALQEIETRSNYPLQKKKQLLNTGMGDEDEDDDKKELRRYFRPVVITGPELHAFTQYLSQLLKAPGARLDLSGSVIASTDDQNHDGDDEDEDDEMEDEDDEDEDDEEDPLPPPPRLPEMRARSTRNSTAEAKYSESDDDDDDDDDDDEDDAEEEGDDSKKMDDEKSSTTTTTTTTNTNSTPSTAAATATPVPEVQPVKAVAPITVQSLLAAPITEPPRNRVKKSNTFTTTLTEQTYGFCPTEEQLNDPIELLCEYQNFCAQFQHLAPLLRFADDDILYAEPIPEEELFEQVDDDLNLMKESTKKNLSRCIRATTFARDALNVPDYHHNWFTTNNSIIIGGIAELHYKLDMLRKVAMRFESNLAKKILFARPINASSRRGGYDEDEEDEEEDEDEETDETETSSSESSDGNPRRRRRGSYKKAPKKVSSRKARSYDDDSSDDSDSGSSKRKTGRHRKPYTKKSAPNGKHAKRNMEDEDEDEEDSGEDSDIEMRLVLKQSKKEAEAKKSSTMNDDGQPKSRLVIESDSE